MDAKKGKPFRPYRYSHRLQMVLVICALMASVFAMAWGFSYSQYRARTELIENQSEVSVYLQNLAQ